MVRETGLTNPHQNFLISFEMLSEPFRMNWVVSICNKLQSTNYSLFVTFYRELVSITHFKFDQFLAIG